MQSIDTALFLWMNATPESPAWLLQLARWLSQVMPALAVLALLPVMLFGPAWRRQVAAALLAMLLAWLAVRAMRWGIHVPRPFEMGLGHQWLPHAATASFPSTHAAVSVAWATGLGFAFRRRPPPLAWGFCLLAAGIAWSRVYLGLHMPVDVLAGAALGVLAGLAAQALLRRLGLAGLPLTQSAGSR